MEATSKSSGVLNPVKTPQSTPSKASILPNVMENENPNHNNSPLSKSASKTKSKISVSKNTRIRERKFLVAKKSQMTQSKDVNFGCKCNGKLNKCLCVAYESLRASQEEFFSDFDKNEGLIQNGEIGEKVGEYGNVVGIFEEGVDEMGDSGIGGVDEMGFLAMKRSRDKLLEEARECVPEPGSGRVMHLVKAFEKMKMLSILKSKGSQEDDQKEGESKGVKWALPGLHCPLDTQSSSSSFCPSDLFLTSECLGLDSRSSSSLDSYRGRNSSDSSLASVRRQWRKKQQLKTTAKPFKLRTEERGKRKEEEFMKKVQQMMEEEEKLRVPIAQGLPWTNNEKECLAKPPTIEATRPIELVLHSDVRAEERAEFDHQVAEKMSLIEQYKVEKERQQKMAEEEESRRLRKELVPKAQPMPYFDRPFIPRRSDKQPTIPKEPKFHIPHHKKIKCTQAQQSWSGTSSDISSSDACYGL